MTGEIDGVSVALSNDYVGKIADLKNYADGTFVEQTEFNALTSDLPNSYLSVGVANSPTADDKLMKRSEVEAKIAGLDVAKTELVSSKTIKSIEEIDGKISVEIQDIQISESQVNNLTSDLAGINSEIDGLQEISGNHENRLTAAEADVDAAEAKIAGLQSISSDLNSRLTTAEDEINGLQTISADQATQIAGLKTISADHETRLTTAEGEIDGLQAISADQATKITGLQTISADHENRLTANAKAIVDEATARANAITSISSTVAGTYLSAAEFAALSNDIGLSAATNANPVVTKNDIADLAGAMHFIGTATLSSESEDAKACLVRTYPSAKKGDVAIIVSTSKEYVYVSDTAGQTAGWIELGDEDLYATKAALATETQARIDGDTATLASAKTYANTLSNALSTEVTAEIAAEATARANADTTLQNNINALRSDVSAYALSADVTSIKNTLNAADTALGTRIDGVVTDLASEVIRAGNAEQVVSAAVDNKIYVDGTKAASLSVIHADSDDYHAKVVAGTVLSNELYVVSADFINAYGEQIKNLAAPELSDDAATKQYVDDVSAAATSDVAALQAKLDTLSTYTHALSVSQLVWDIDTINCGSAS